MPSKFKIARFDAIIAGDADLGELNAFKREREISHVSPIERRRLSKGAKMCVSLLRSAEGLPIVFASRLGESNRCFAMLDTIARGEPLSPAAFCVSTHNAIPAQNAIFTGNRGEISAISADLALEAGVALAASRLAECEKIAVLSYFEDMNNEILDYSNLIYALLLILERGEDFSLEFNSNLTSQASEARLCDGGEVSPLDPSKVTVRGGARTKFNGSNLNGDISNLKCKNSDFAFLRAMLAGENEWRTEGSNLIWTWRRETAN